MTDREPTVAQAARLYARAGWPVHALHDVSSGVCSCDDGSECAKPGRHPRTPHGFYDATTDLQTVEEWWRRWPNANIGVRMGGPRGLAVVDLDGEAGQASWQRLTAEHGRGLETATAITPHGSHRWYRLPSGLSVPRRIGSVAEHVDILGAGYVVAAPSVVDREHPDKHKGLCSGRYEWRMRQIAMLPDWVARLANRRERQEGIQSATPERVTAGMRQARGRTYGEVALAGECARVTAAAKGVQNDTLNRAAYRLGRLVAGGELDRDLAEQALMVAAEQCGHVAADGERQAWRTIQSGIAAGMRRPRTRESRERQRGGWVM